MPGIHSINDLPWIPFAAIRYIEKMILTPETRVFEFGSGGSTVWFAGRCGHVVAVENRLNIYEAVTEKLAELGRSERVEYLYRPKGKNGLVSYVSAIDEYKEDFDVIFIDGRERTACMEKAKSRVKPGGYLILDNPDAFPPPRGLFSDWEAYNFYAFGWQPSSSGIQIVDVMWPCIVYRNVTMENCRK